MLHAADGLLPGRVLMAREVEEAEQVTVPDVEEEVVGTRVVTVLHQLYQRKPEEVLVELDRLLGVTADQGQMVDTLDGGMRSARLRSHVLLAQFLPAGADPLEFLTFWLRHDCLLDRGRDLLLIQCRRLSSQPSQGEASARR